MEILEMCFGDSKEGFIELSFGGLDRHLRRWVPATVRGIKDIEGKEEAYFGPAVRSAEDMGKTNCRGARVCWVDCDYIIGPNPVMPPTAVVWSGNGYHVYWKLDKEYSPDAVESVNELLAKPIQGDSAHNIDRMLRIPTTINAKDPEKPKLCKLLSYHPDRVYPLKSLAASAGLPDTVVRKIVDGNRQGHRSRSERDWAIVLNLVRQGLSDDEIQLIFQTHDCGDKVRDPRTSDDYLKHTIGRARREGDTQHPQFIERDNAYWAKDKQISTFIMQPKLLLEGDTDSLVVDIRAQGTRHIWRDVVFPREAFDGLNKLNRHLSKAAWIWLGRDADVRSLLKQLIGQLQSEDVPRAVATKVVGRHALEQDHRQFLVFDGGAMASDGDYWEIASEAPIMYIPTGREHPMVDLTDEGFGQVEAKAIAELLPKVNAPEVMWPLIGWYMACPYKTILEEMYYRFPILNICGTKGSGKSTTILRVFLPLLGYVNPFTYDVETTQFGALSLLGSTNSVPLAFSEFRAAGTRSSFLRYVLLSYDTGHDTRGRADQTTVDYPLIAPFSVDGEDMISDPAALERMIVVLLGKGTVVEEGPCWRAFNELVCIDLRSYARPYWLHCLQEDIKGIIPAAMETVRKSFTQSLPDRIRRNLGVCWAGVLSYQHFMAKYGVRVSLPSCQQALQGALDNVYSTQLGRAPVAADEFIEFVVNAAAGNSRSFPWEFDDTNILWFQMTPAYELYNSRRSHQRTNVLSKESLRTQMKELMDDYTVKPKLHRIDGKMVLAYGVDLERAAGCGLDVPASREDETLIIRT